MRSVAPHPLVRFRMVLLILALAAFVVAACTLGFFKGSATFPVAPVVAAAAICFVWLNGAYWWLELRYPQHRAGTGQVCKSGGAIQQIRSEERRVGKECRSR